MKQKRHFQHLKQSHRDRMEALLSAGHAPSEIARILKVDKSTISRERKRRRKNGRYDATMAQEKANVTRSRSKYQGMKIEAHPLMREAIIRYLGDKRSPDEIAGRMKREGRHVLIGTNAIYKWLYSPWGQQYCQCLCTKRCRKKKQKKLPQRKMIPGRISLVKRPKQGIHAEGDLFVSPMKTGSQRSGAVICVPDAQLLVGTMIENKKPAVMAQAVRTMKERIAVEDITMDNGMENRNHQSFGLPAYFCNPRSPWQKPHVENGIGLLRRWFIGKKTDLKNVSEADLQQYLHILNAVNYETHILF